MVLGLLGDRVAMKEPEDIGALREELARAVSEREVFAAELARTIGPLEEKIQGLSVVAGLWMR